MEKKKVLIVGVGVQGSTVAKCIDGDSAISEIICADRDEKAVNELVATLKKGKGVVIDCTDKERVAALAKGVDLVVNALPIPMMMPAMEAALEAKTNCLDFNSPVSDFEGDIMKTYKDFFEKYDKAFKEAGRTYFGGAGAAPGLVNVIARYTMRFLDSCDTIIMLYNEGLRTKRFIPFWWCPPTALEGMEMPGIAYMNGELVITKQYSGVLYRNWPELGRETAFYEHAHPEPITIGCFSETHFKGVKNAHFKYGGAGMDFAKPLYDLGLLSKKPVEIDGAYVIPYKLIEKHLPPAPKSKEEIKAIIDEGIIEENSAVVIESTGMKNGRKVLVEAHVFSPGLEESFEKIGFSSEMYQTGMSGALFTRMILGGDIQRTGAVTADMLSDDEVDCFLRYAEKEGHIVEVSIRQPIKEVHEVLPYVD